MAIEMLENPLEVGMRGLAIGIVAGMAWLGPQVVRAQVAAPSEPVRPAATSADWQSSGAPLLFGGSAYYPSGPTVFFNGSVMVRSGSFEGVPIYIDATREPSNVVYVPVTGGQMRPYERRRADQIADTVVPSPAPPPKPAEPEIPVATPGLPQQGSLTGPSAVRAGAAARPAVVESIPRAYANRGIWIEFGGRIWLASGAAGPYWPGRFDQIGSYHGFPVYQESGHTDQIYVPSVQGGPIARYSLSNERVAAPCASECQ
jgi:hypothetical protein